MALLVNEIADNVANNITIRQKNAKIAELGRELSAAKRNKA